MMVTGISSSLGVFHPALFLCVAVVRLVESLGHYHILHKRRSRSRYCHLLPQQYISLYILSRSPSLRLLLEIFADQYNGLPERARRGDSHVVDSNHNSKDNLFTRVSEQSKSSTPHIHPTPRYDKGTSPDIYIPFTF